jgi:hypothetical protein
MRRKVAAEPVRRELPLQEKEEPETIDAGKVISGGEKAEQPAVSSSPAAAVSDADDDIKPVNGDCKEEEQEDDSTNDIHHNNT